jgi:peptidoglycan/LPS O-acetylase OafA/YrhL
VGADLFFVLSGYLITSILQNEQAAAGSFSLKNFYIRRMLRLLPAFYLLLLVMLALTGLMAKPTAHLLSIAAASAYVMNWVRAFDLLSPGLLGHTWTLAAEEQFYLLWPLALLVIPRRRLVPCVAVAIAGEIAWRLVLVHQGAEVTRTYHGLDTHSEALLLGCLIALVKARRLGPLLPRGTIMIPAVFLVGFAATARVAAPLTQTAGLSLAALMAGWLILAVLESEAAKRALAWRPLVFTGQISYGWYLWHYPLFNIAELASGGSGNLGIAGTFAVIAGSCLVAVLSHRYVERPFMRLKDKFAADARASITMPEADTGIARLSEGVREGAATPGLFRIARTDGG